MLLLLVAFFLPPASALDVWRQEIQSRGGIEVQLVRTTVEGGAIALPADVRHRQLLAGYTENPNFINQFRAAQALSISYRGAEGKRSFVLVNTALAGTGEDEEAIIAHEYGHLWLKALGYGAPVYTGGPTACLALHTGDAVQHVLIRAELEKRRLHWRQPWLRTLETALAAMQTAGESPAPPPDRCQAMARVGLWIDVALGLNQTQWSRRAEFLDALRVRFPAIAPPAEEIVSYLAGEDLADPARHQAALQFVFTRMKEFALTLPAN